MENFTGEAFHNRYLGFLATLGHLELLGQRFILTYILVYRISTESTAGNLLGPMSDEHTR